MWMYASPVAYPLSLVPERWRLPYSLNPMVGVIEGSRWAVVGTGQANLGAIGNQRDRGARVVAGGSDVLRTVRVVIRGRRLMDQVVMRVEGLAKRYEIGVARRRQDTLRDYLRERLKALSRRATTPREKSQSFWALEDVSFEVTRGEVVGIIGRNGAGKSTLLKILARITEPTRGRAEIVGRVASLLEVGTGFDRELTGRENVYLSGAIMGMRKSEIDRRFDEIVDFSGIERFIDTPVKRYSSGMYVRLAFAVAAHLEPEILIVDEVLAVGDAAFQRKCLGRMSDVTRQGRTVLFVSHNMGAVETLCKRGLVLEAGRVVFDGPVPAGGGSDI